MTGLSMTGLSMTGRRVRWVMTHPTAKKEASA